jgi:hypothetical protein
MNALRCALVALLVVGCSSIPGGSVNPRTPTPAATAATNPPTDDIVMCQLMPLGDVQAKSPFQTPLAEFKQSVVAGMCEYSSASDAEEPVSVLLVVTTFNSAEDAQTSLASARQSNVDSGVPVADITGLGDEAFGAGEDEVGVHAVLGTRVIDANMGGEWPDTTSDAKVAAGTELVRTIISRLP